MKRHEDAHLVYHEEVGVGDTRTPLTRNFVSTLRVDRVSQDSANINGGYYRNIDNVDDKICQLS